MSLTKQEILNIESQTGTRQIELRRDFNQATNLSAGGKRPLNAYMKAMLQAKENGDSSFMYKGVKYVRVETENNRMGGCFYMREGKKLSGGGLLEELESYASSDSQTASQVSDPSYVSSDVSSYYSSNASYDNDKLQAGKGAGDKGYVINKTSGEKEWQASDCTTKSQGDCKAPCRKTITNKGEFKCKAPRRKNGKFAITGYVSRQTKKGKRWVEGKGRSKGKFVKAKKGGAKSSRKIDIPVRKYSMKKSSQAKLRDVVNGYADKTRAGGVTASQITYNSKTNRFMSKKKARSVKNNKWLQATREAGKAFKKLSADQRDAFRFTYNDKTYRIDIGPKGQWKYKSA